MPRSTDQSDRPASSSRCVSYKEKSSVVARPKASVNTTWALPAPLMLGTVFSWNGPAGTWPVYCRIPLMYSSTCEGSAAAPRKAGSGVVVR